MDSENEELYLMKLKQYVYDEDKIVTALWLSKKFNIDIELSQCLLQQFIEDHKSTKSGILGISYILIGTNKDSQSTIMIVKHDQLEEKKKLLRETLSQSIYSVQKAVDVNFNLIGMVDMLKIHGDNGTISGCPVSKNCVLRKNLPNRTLPTVSRAAGTDKSKASHLFAGKSQELKKTQSAPEIFKKEDVKQEPKELKSHKSDNSVQSKSTKLTKQNSGDKQANKQGGSNSIANMFAKAPPPKEKPEKSKKEIKIESENDESDANEENVSKKRKISQENEKTKVKSPKKEKVNDLYDSGTDEEAQKIENANKAKNGKVEAKTSKKKTPKPRNKRQREDKNDDRPEKKRKRFVQHVDSDEDIFGEDDNNEEENNSNIVESDDDDKTAVNTQKTLAPKNRKRKFVDKTYTDEEGYIVTKKELVYESAESEEEDKENPPKKPPAPKKVASPKKVSPPTNGKNKKKQPVKPTNQPTLMNFFKKK